MKFKLLHVRPHVWYLKQKETLASKATSDDNSSPEGPFVFKRSPSLKLVKSGPSADSCKGSGSGSAPSNKHVKKQGKNVQICTVVDAGCTCRATVTSDEKQKRAPNSSNASSRDMGSLHDVCRPRRAHVLEMKGEKYGAATPKAAHLPAKSAETNGSMVSRLVCRSSRDVIKHTQLDAGQRRIDVSSSHDEGTQLNACAAHIRDEEEVSVTQFDVHELECRLRKAGLEERRRSSYKKNKLYYEEESLTSSGVGSSLGTSANTETVPTTATSEMQDMVLNGNATCDTNVLPAGDRVMMSLDDLRASIAQKKLANLSPRPSLCTDNMRLFENVAFTGSPSSFSSETTRSSNVGSPHCVSHPNVHAHKEKLEVNVKHIDMGVNKRMFSSGFDDVANQGLGKQSHRVSSNVLNKVKEVAREDSTPGRAARRIDLGIRKEIDTVQHDIVKSRVKRCPTQGGSNRSQFGLAPGGTHAHDTDGDVCALDGRVLGYPESEVGQDKQVVSSSSCEIQVLSDYNHDNQSDAEYNYPMLRIHVGATSSAPSDRENAGVHVSEEGAPSQELMQSESAVAMVKSSYDPKRDFKESMLEMVMAKRLRTPRQLQQLLQCYLSLNPPHYHPIIIKVFHEFCSELFS